MTIAKNKVVHIHYTLKNRAGKILDSSEGQDPLVYIQGTGNLIPGLEKALEGKKSGDKVNAVIPPEEAYGIRNSQLVQKVPLTEFPAKEPLKVGDQFQVSLPEGMAIATVVNVDTTHATVDMNHPLADETLHFDVTIGDIREATKEELDHGHIHGAGGHEH